MPNVQQFQQNGLYVSSLLGITRRRGSVANTAHMLHNCHAPNH